MKFSFKLGKETITRELPTRWEEVTFKMFCDVAEAKDDIDILAIVTGLDRESLRKVKILNLDTIMAAMSFLKSPCPQSLPKTILGYKVSKDLSYETTGQYEDLRNDLNANKDASGIDQIKRYPLYCAIYCCPQEYGEYDWEKAEWMSKWFWNAPAGEVLAVGNFTLAKLTALKLGIKVDFHPRISLRKRLTLAFRILLMRLGFTARSYTWKAKQGTGEKNYSNGQ